MENWIGLETAITALFGVMPIHDQLHLDDYIPIHLIAEANISLIIQSNQNAFIISESI